MGAYQMTRAKAMLHSPLSDIKKAMLLTGLGATNGHELVISANIKRRHLTISQRAMMAADVANVKFGENQWTMVAEG